MAPVVSVEALRKRYRRRDPWAVDGVTFALEPGQAFGLLGPNGSGKTSVVKMIAGLLRPDGGDISLFGSKPGDPAARAQLGFAPEDPDFPKFLRAREVLDYFASLLGLDEDGTQAANSRRRSRSPASTRSGARSASSPRA